MPSTKTPPVTLALLVANSVILLLANKLPGPFFDRWALWGIGDGFEPWQPVSYAFIHAGVGHLVANMLGLWMFGSPVERAVGPRKFLMLYVASILAAAAVQLGVDARLEDPSPTVGASGGVFGILAGFAMLFPKNKVALMLFPIPMPAPVFVALYAAGELFSGVTDLQPGVAHFAHLGGLLGGLVVAGDAWRQRQTRATIPLG